MPNPVKSDVLLYAVVIQVRQEEAVSKARAALWITEKPELHLKICLAKVGKHDDLLNDIVAIKHSSIFFAAIVDYLYF